MGRQRSSPRWREIPTQPSQTFHRVFYTREHLDRWKEGRHTSFHTALGAPPEWRLTWLSGNSSDPADYPLCIRSGVYTENARKRFLELAPVTVKTDPRDKEEWPRDVAELAGVCCGFRKV
jgi:hypothetical protein